ncbi:MAG: hypothetical protein SOY69_04180, partial [Alloprevotella sp.]|nr:hypothetical protein [Alloprevotella sp.]
SILDRGFRNLGVTLTYRFLTSPPIPYNAPRRMLCPGIRRGASLLNTALSVSPGRQNAKTTAKARRMSGRAAVSGRGIWRGPQ